MPPLAPCGCIRDPDHDQHHCPRSRHRGEDFDHWVDAGAQAARHILDLGYTPLLRPDTLRALHARGGDDRRLAQKLFELAGGDAA